MYRPKIMSRHPSHRDVAPDLRRFPFRAVVRLGSYRTPTPQGVTVTINSPEACNNAADKAKMKACFVTAEVKTAQHWSVLDFVNIPDEEKRFPIVAKNIMGSRGTGVFLLKTLEEFNQWLSRPTRRGQQYIIEKFIDYGREYRLHVTEDGCFYTCRKAMKRDTPDGDKWKFNCAHTVWLREDNAQFAKPSNWAEIEAECVKALKAVGLHVGAVDVKVSRKTRRAGSKFFILEINSAPSFGDLTREHYVKVLPELIEKQKAKQDAN